MGLKLKFALRSNAQRLSVSFADLFQLERSEELFNFETLFNTKINAVMTRNMFNNI